MRLRVLLAGLVGLALLLALPVTEGISGTNHKVRVEAGQQQLVPVGGVTLRISTDAPIVLMLEISGDSVEGLVEPARDSGGQAVVEIFKVGPPDALIFKGKVIKATPFDDIYPHETGHAEM